MRDITGLDTKTLVYNFFNNKNYKQYTSFCLRHGANEEIEAYLAGKPLGQIEVYRLASCERFEHIPALVNLLENALDAWAEYLTYFRRDCADMFVYFDKIYHLMSGHPIGDIEIIEHIIAETHLDFLKKHLNKTYQNPDKAAIWNEFFPKLFFEHPDLALLFLGKMIEEKIMRKDRARPFEGSTELDDGVLHMLVRCGYFFAYRTDASFMLTPEGIYYHLAYENFMNVAISKQFYKDERYINDFRYALKKYLFLGIHPTIKDYILEGDKDLVEIFISIFEEIFSEKKFSIGYDDLTSYRVVLAKIIGDLPPNELNACNKEWADLQQKLQQESQM